MIEAKEGQLWMDNDPRTHADGCPTRFLYIESLRSKDGKPGVVCVETDAQGNLVRSLRLHLLKSRFNGYRNGYSYVRSVG